MFARPVSFALLLATGLSGQASPDQPLSATSLPVRAVTVFKDGHAFVQREGPLPADAGGRIVVDELPAPLLGTFWPYARDGASLVSAVAGAEEVTERVEPADLRTLVAANLGRAAVVVIDQGERISGTLRELLGANDELLVMQTATGVRVLTWSRVRDVEMAGDLVTTVEQQTQRNRLTLRVSGGGAEAKVGMVYVQRGLRWIPAYQFDLDGAGKARVKLQATLVNDLVDLVDAEVHLVVGVPKFAFEGMVDPISLQQEIAQVVAQNPQFAFANNILSNSLMTQTGRSMAAPVSAPAQQDPSVDGGQDSEDLFVYTVQHVTLRRGERMVLPVLETELSYRDVYRLDVPIAPPQEYRQGLQDQRVFELAKLMQAPKARHVLRIENGSTAPLTTAPALVLENGRLLAQAHVLYTSRGGTTDLEINTAIDVQVDVDEREIRRENAVLLGDDNYRRIDLVGTITLHSHKAAPITIEVERAVLGLVDSASADGTFRQVDLAHVWEHTARPPWWGWWGWPWWWFRWNGFGKVNWQLELAPGQQVVLETRWHYFWR